MKLTDLKKGDRVLYVPHHVNGDSTHPDCQSGVVKRTNDTWVFVIYDNAMQEMRTGDEPYTAAATDPEQLEKVGR